MQQHGLSSIMIALITSGAWHLSNEFTPNELKSFASLAAPGNDKPFVAAQPFCRFFKGSGFRV